MTYAKNSTLVLATSNAHKVRELTGLLAPLNVVLRSMSDFPGLRPVVEDGETLADNARRKASQYARQLGQWVLADDTGLEVDALDGAPGVRSSRFAGEQANMAENRSRLLAELRLVAQAPWTARFVCHLAVANPAGDIVIESVGECHGRIRAEPAGDGGFGYDSLFEVAGYERTLAELGPDETAAVGHRAQAVRELVARWCEHMGVELRTKARQHHLPRRRSSQSS
jgi:XTP/dITP diphosphohydrolase